MVRAFVCGAIVVHRDSNDPNCMGAEWTRDLKTKSSSISCAVDGSVEGPPSKDGRRVDGATETLVTTCY